VRYLQLTGLFFKLSGLNELQYRANFFMQLFSSLLDLAIGIAGLGLVFYHTESLAGWSPAELLAVLGVYTIIHGLTQVAIQPNMSRLMGDVHRGTLDYLLVKPEDSQFLTSVWEFQIWKLLDILLGVGVLTAAIIWLESALGLIQALGFGLLLLCGSLIVYSFWLMLTTTSFWLVRVHGILELFESIYQAGRWPITIYPLWLRLGLTFLVPVAFAVTVPAESLTGRLSGQTLAFTVILTASALAISRLFWKTGLRRYSGASA
jgi:ABC-2 type transport system permease protein